MIQEELRTLIGSVIATLSDIGARFHVTGGLAASYYGEPRMTQDVDFVVVLDSDQLDRLVERLSVDFLIDHETAANAVRSRQMFQALHYDFLIKVDFHVGPMIDGELDRSRHEPLFEGVIVPLVSKEDAILSKLVWYEKGSAKAEQDILGMLRDPGPVDRILLRRLAESLGAGDTLRRIEREADRDT